MLQSVYSTALFERVEKLVSFVLKSVQKYLTLLIKTNDEVLALSARDEVGVF